MASSLQTLIKILRLEQQKEYQNRAVIGGLGRFAYHWAREAHSQAGSDERHALVDDIAVRLRDYDALPEAERPATIEAIIGLASSSADEQSSHSAGRPAKPAPSGAVAEASAPPVESAGDLAIAAPETDPDEFETVSPDEAAATVVVSPQTTRERRGYAWKEPPVATPDLIADMQKPVSALPNVGEKRDELFERLNVRTVSDLLHFFPHRYDDYSRMKMIRKLELGEEITVIGTLTNINKIRTKQGTLRIDAILQDDSGALKLNWFNQPWIEEKLKDGEAVVASGKIEQYLGRLVMNAPELEPLESEWLQAGRIVPVYHLTKGLSGKFVRKIAKAVIDQYATGLPDYLPLPMREDADLMDYGDAVSQTHFPDSPEDLNAAQHRLAFDELFVLHVAMLRQRYAWQSRPGFALAVDDDWTAAFRAALPYPLTDAQERAIADIRHDMSGNIPMNRLLQGDVGSGKTVVATIAMAMAIANGAQAALMAPTSILAEQHFQNVSQLLLAGPGGEGIQIALLTGATNAGDRATIYAGLADGSLHAVIGTHALIQPDVRFARLGLAVIDEQHRFGVIQRGALRDKADGGNPHLLVMTATPIPRTLALTVHADLDLTVIDEMPPGRVSIQTRVLQPKERERAYAFVRSQIQQGRQAYVIYPLVEESDKLEARAAVAEHKRLQETIFPDLAVGLLHGRMRPDEKDSVMESFYRGDTHILVSTSVIEVGIDVPNASVMMVENANRFGLAQLHQLRGRVGRGAEQSYCLLMADQHSLDGDDRLRAVEENADGFALAEIDWQQRGAGDLLGVAQSGFGRLDFSRLMDSKLVDLVQREARAVHDRDPELQLDEHQALADRVARVGAAGDVS